MEQVLASPVVAIVIPVHNGERTLARTLENLSKQTFTDFSVTIVENASTDDTIKIATFFCEKDARFSIDVGAEFLPALENFSRAAQIGAATGKYFMLRACDDTAAPDYLEKLVAVLDAQPSRLLAAGSTRLVGGEKGERFKRPNANVLRFHEGYLSGQIPRNLTFPAEWIYGLFRAESAERLLKRWNELGTPWCSASYAVFDFVVHDEVAFVDDAVFEFSEGSGSATIYGEKTFRKMLRRRLNYSLGCFALRHTLPRVGPATTLKFLLMCWSDSRRKTGYKLLGWI